MRASRLVAATTFAAVLAAAGACADDERASEPQQEAEVAFEVLLDEVYCGLEDPLRLVVRDEEDWARLWSSVYRSVEPMPELPQVDFSREMVIVVSMGMRTGGGFNIEVDRITSKGDVLEVVVHEVAPPPEAMMSAALTQPVEIVRLEGSDQEVKFVDAETTPKRER